MATFAERLASFDVTHPATKKRTSSAKSAKTLRWPHQNPSPTQLAEAGFIYRPSSSSPDNATCFLCHSNLDGWEEDDNPAAEHLKLSSDCGWAINICIEQDVGDVRPDAESPTSGRMSEARKMTFGSKWPHENKRGWVCKSQKMADAGWYFCPTDESDDFVRCAYCNLSLDGWEPKDNPYDEHQRRSTDCAFFNQSAPKAKPSRGRKARASKEPRHSTQSNSTTAIEDMSMAALSITDNNDSVMVLDNDITKSKAAGKAPRKGTKIKKSNSKPRGKAAKSGVEESTQASSFVEPEDDDFEVKVAPEPKKPTRGRKRKSEEVRDDHDTADKVGAGSLAGEPPAKKRATRTRASSAQPESQGGLAEQVAYNDDTYMADAVVMPPPPALSKKGVNGGRKRGSSTARKGSATSTASMASLRATFPEDGIIEAALEAELDRSQTDDEAAMEPTTETLPKTRRFTRTRPTSRNGPASVAPARRTTRVSTIATNMRESIELQSADGQKPGHEPGQETSAKSEPRATKAGLARNVSHKVAEHSSALREDSMQEVLDLDEEFMNQKGKLPSQSKVPKSRQVSRKAPTRRTRTSQLSSAKDVDYPILNLDSSAPNSSVLGSLVNENESGHETDASIANQGPKKRGPKKRVVKGKKTKGDKKTGIMSRNIEDIVQPDIIVQVVVEQPPRLDVAAVEEPMETAEQDTADTTAPEKGLKKKTAKSTEAKTIKPQAIPIASSPPPSQMSEPWTDQPLGESTPLQASRAEVPTFTPLEAAKTAAPPPAATPETKALPEPLSTQRTPRPAGSPQSSDAENQPPSSRPSALRPPLEVQTPTKSQAVRIPLAASTPSASPSRRNISKLQTSIPWTAVDLENFLLVSPNVDKENIAAPRVDLTSPERKLTVEEWICNNARKGEERLRNECERLVGKFEGEGVRALKTLEGIVCAEQ